MPKKNKSAVKRAIVTPDKHFPLADGPAMTVVAQAIELVKPDIYIDLGDVGEWHGCSHWQWKKKKRPPLEYQMPFIDDDIEAVNDGMDFVDLALNKADCKERHMIEGNHDDWMNRFVDEHPYLADKYRFKDAIRLKERGWIYHPNSEFLRIGDLHFYHGNQFAGIQHTRNHLMRLGSNVMYGHHHDIQQSSVTHLSGQKSAWSIGCLKDMSKEQNAWLGGSPHNWSHAFAVVDFYDKGHFTVHVVSIVDGKTSLWGEVLDGN